MQGTKPWREATRRNASVNTLAQLNSTKTIYFDMTEGNSLTLQRKKAELMGDKSTSAPTDKQGWNVIANRKVISLRTSR